MALDSYTYLLCQNEEAEEVADDFEMDDDYGVDHYASDNEFGGDNGDFGEGEADF